MLLPKTTVKKHGLSKNAILNLYNFTKIKIFSKTSKKVLTKRKKGDIIIGRR